ncbi:glycoside hydrolase family 85 protein [Cucurbitaria berberidis CBS 394.84]|uniref:Glycoside hydrolase family 85 protein n=1 Tax=Cucurbitaria berberidis CBS 394.84 TaxID=1168544 RepID=A0A9P4L7Q2_9PLEO|nr:glycoside hydrolase family 85 protein [Cucurbitaria berberidis CBS 394.84]KAF1844534.1 glycoside hydrolase family 85 protein [Cucurbitaria berberidis CBS 394.84]
MANLLGWKDILRPIRDGYRHLFPAPDTGPTPEERRQQREKDRLQGFTYFNTFHQLETWTRFESDPLQRANTPLLRRRSIERKDDTAKADVLLIHDYGGNYHTYESFQGIGIEEEMYTCEYLQYVDTFIYFSHKLVCVPPPTWTNTLHRNGVLSLGTILIEPQTESSGRLLQHTKDSSGMVFPMVKILSDIAQHYGFDGWLLNVEKPFPKADWNSEILEMFICHLRGALGIGTRLIWYDALTLSNTVSYQNALNSSNIAFASDSGSMLTNYCWTEADVERSKQVAVYNMLPLQNISFGIDVWAQNTSKLTHPRVTYPEKGGGGTNTGVAVSKLAELGFSAGIFAPAWSFEHFPDRGRAVERAIWEGSTLPQDLDCSCGHRSTRHQPNLESPIIRSASEFAAGSEAFFYTDFSRAFGKHEIEQNDVFGGHDMHAQLGAQSISPRPSTSEYGNQTIGLAHQLVYSLGRTRLVIEAYRKSSTTDDAQIELWLPLYKLDMPANGSLHLKASCRNLLGSTTGAMISYYLRSTSGLQFLPVPESDGIQSLGMAVGRTNHHITNVHLQELGFYIRGSIGRFGEVVQLLEVFEVCILPRSALGTVKSCSISDVRIEHRGERQSKHARLCWSFDSMNETESAIEGMPYSEITGPFSYFNIRLDGLQLSRAYALEFPLPRGLVERLKDQDVEVWITGIGFDGQELAENKVALSV